MNATDVKRIAFTVHYDGEEFFGWQLQPEQRSVQGELEGALGRLFDRPARVTGSGRTDRGVHSTGQVAAVDAPVKWEPATLRRALNAVLPPSIWIAHMAEVGPRFHPRFDAVSRSYRYRVGVSGVSASPFHRRWCWALGRPLDLPSLEEATAGLVGDQSFRAFAKAGQEERGDRCIVTEARWDHWDPLGVEFHISANRFLHHMVRYLVGTLAEIGMRRRPVDDIGRLLKGEAGVETSPPAPARGLFLTRVRYQDGQYPVDPADADAFGTTSRPADPGRGIFTTYESDPL